MPATEAPASISLLQQAARLIDFQVGEEDAAAEQVRAGASVHLSFEHLDVVDVAFDGAGPVTKDFKAGSPVARAAFIQGVVRPGPATGQARVPAAGTGRACDGAGVPRT